MKAKCGIMCDAAIVSDRLRAGFDINYLPLNFRHPNWKNHHECIL